MLQGRETKMSVDVVNRKDTGKATVIVNKLKKGKIK